MMPGEKMNSDLWDTLSNGVVAIDKNLRIISFSRGAERITGYEASGVMGLPCQEVFKANFCDKDCPVKKVLRIQEAVANFRGEIKNFKKETVLLSGNATPLKDTRGEIIGAILNFRDDSEVYKLTRELFKETVRLQTILNSIADGVFTVDTEWRITSFNPAAERITGYKKEEVMGKPCSFVFRSKFCQEGCPLKTTIETGKSISNFEMEIVDSQGKSIPISASTALLLDEEGEIIGGVETFRDLSTLKRLSEELTERYSFGNIIGKNVKMKEVYNLIETVSYTLSTILIQGETGTGKELVAKAIHYHSPRRDKPFLKVSCAALPETLLESELFGYKKGAFTGAIKDKPGRFELANGGTIFLDEVGEIPTSTQVKLLRVLEEREFEPLGSTKTIRVDVRVIAATNRDLKKAIRESKFREDLYYRLNVVPIFLPPLRERSDDIPLLVKHFIEQFNQKTEKKILGVAPEVMDLFLDYPWPGNVRELENAMEHAFVHCQGGVIQIQHLPEEIRGKGRDLVEKVLALSTPLAEMEKQVILEILRRNNYDREKSAKALRISRTTLWRKIKKYGIQNHRYPKSNSP